jgi:hypothetical protein
MAMAAAGYGDVDTGIRLTTGDPTAVPPLEGEPAGPPTPISRQSYPEAQSSGTATEDPAFDILGTGTPATPRAENTGGMLYGQDPFAAAAPPPAAAGAPATSQTPQYDPWALDRAIYEAQAWKAQVAERDQQLAAANQLDAMLRSDPQFAAEFGALIQRRVGGGAGSGTAPATPPQHVPAAAPPEGSAAAPAAPPQINPQEIMRAIGLDPRAINRLGQLVENHDIALEKMNMLRQIDSLKARYGSDVDEATLINYAKARREPDMEKAFIGLMGERTIRNKYAPAAPAAPPPAPYGYPYGYPPPAPYGYPPPQAAYGYPTPGYPAVAPVPVPGYPGAYGYPAYPPVNHSARVEAPGGGAGYGAPAPQNNPLQGGDRWARAVDSGVAFLTQRR